MHVGKRKISELDAQEAKVRAALSRLSDDAQNLVAAVQDVPVKWSTPVISDYISDQARSWAARAGADAATRWSHAWGAIKGRLSGVSRRDFGVDDSDFSDI